MFHFANTAFLFQVSTLTKGVVLALLMITAPTITLANQGVSPDGIWERKNPATSPTLGQKKASSETKKTILKANLKIIKEKLNSTPKHGKRKFGQAGVQISLPLDDGNFALFEVYENPIMAAGLAEKYPAIKTFKAYGVNDKKLTAVLDVGPRGFHGMINANGKVIYIDPDLKQYKESKSEPDTYYAFEKEEASSFVCLNKNEHNFLSLNESSFNTNTYLQKQNGDKIRKFRLAVSTTGEYAAAVSSSTADRAETQSAIATAISRVNQILNQDLAVELELITENDSLIFLNSSADPYSNSASADIDKVTEEIDAILTGGNADYDIGHLFTVDGGGLAFLGSACDTQFKGAGVTGVSAANLTSDAFYVDYVAHELGHQLGANHTFNADSELCGGGNRNASTAFEPGSGSTVMAYAGICSPQNLQNNSDPYFHAGSIAEILDFLESPQGSCFDDTTNSNDNPPTVSAGVDRNIPARTPFFLEASGSDADGGSIFYTWEQMNAGAVSSDQTQMSSDDGTRPLFRSFTGTTETRRYFPSFEDVLDQTTSFGETYPTTSRTLSFRVTARSNSYGIDSDDTQIFVTDTGEAFEVVEPFSNAYHFENTSMRVLWLSAGTNNIPISCPNVDILLSTNDSNNFNTYTTLLTQTNNDGSADVTLPNTTTSLARLIVKCSDNIFYNVSKDTFNIINSSESLLAVTVSNNDITEGNSGSQNVTFTITRSGNLNQSSSVNYSIQGSGSNPANTDDFSSNQSLSGVLNFANNETTKSITIVVTGDVELENDERLSLTLSNEQNAFLSTKNALLTIRNDDLLTEENEGTVETKIKIGGGGGSLTMIQTFLLFIALAFRSLLKPNRLFLIFISTFLLSCVPLTNEKEIRNTEKNIDKNIETKSDKNFHTEHPQLTALQWVKSANPEDDARKALETGDLDFLAYNLKGKVNVPGLSLSQEKTVIEKKSYRLQEGMGDLIINAEHLQLRKDFLHYASIFNQKLAKHLL
jgi:hypothetical protein